MTFPWESPKPSASGMPWSVQRPELTKDPVTGLYPGERDGIPGFLRRVRMPDGTVVIGLENVK